MVAKKNLAPVPKGGQRSGSLSRCENDVSQCNRLVRQISVKTCGNRGRETLTGILTARLTMRPSGLQASNLLHIWTIFLLLGDLCFQIPPSRQSVGFPQAVANEKHTKWESYDDPSRD